LTDNCKKITDILFVSLVLSKKLLWKISSLKRPSPWSWLGFILPRSTEFSFHLDWSLASLALPIWPMFVQLPKLAWLSRQRRTICLAGNMSFPEALYRALAYFVFSNNEFQFQSLICYNIKSIKIIIFVIIFEQFRVKFVNQNFYLKCYYCFFAQSGPQFIV
jgi:hypothetical protein